MKTEVRDFVVEVLRDVLHLEIGQDVTDDTPLELESLFLVELVVQAEARFGVGLDDEEFYQDPPGTIGALVQFIVDRRSAAQPSGAVT
ncbi:MULTISPECIES: acyl carrier protein [Actinoalloteichus]|uniref:Acyl carrier protein n=1 Tax=Actinoalloteichus fjordicus TaxID=1612552 RepID=A0AAC9L9E2_9PSEU|nr:MULTISPECIES: acyl carrier protein [Actinoalloteichus]APU13366.1 acyl carrier protein [Actinoalloteichus fjordicus]APU19316.1 acyl carrier protein [Actinoalloteichus sp. GBA129-24]